jgi:hypothetical protein
MTLADFETLVLGQRSAVVPWAAVTDYSFEARKAIEGQHPRLILDVFKPNGIIDAGCGPGHLVRLLKELAPALAPKIVGIDKATRDGLGDLADPFLWQTWQHWGADLVICREVLEHLTIREIRIAVTNLCRISQRWVYVTTRFHPNPTSLLDVATSDDLDPTHISMLNQDLLRALFVLEGFKRDREKEQALDWMQKGRVLVYERV